MIVPLKGKELVNSGDCSGVRAPQQYYRTTRNAVSGVLNERAPSSHLTGSRNLPGMNEAGQREIAASKCSDDLAHVDANLSHTRGVSGVSLEGDAAAVGQRFELVK